MFRKIAVRKSIFGLAENAGGSARAIRSPPNHAEKRRRIAKRIGFGRKFGVKRDPLPAARPELA
jgi:hypothetical protein